MSIFKRAGLPLHAERERASQDPLAASHPPGDGPGGFPSADSRPFADLASRMRPSPRLSPDEPPARQTIDPARLKRLGLVCPGQPESELAEEMRLLKSGLFSRLRPALPDGRCRTVMVTSALPGEGKTFTAVNLALSLATERDHTVLLVDGDVLRPKALDVLGIRPGRGLLDVAEDPSLAPADVIVPTSIPGLSLLPSGRPRPNSTELLSSSRMAWVCDELTRQPFNRIVVFDAPPLLRATTPIALAVHVGHIIFVIEAFRSRQADVTAALQLLNGREDVMLVLNRSTRAAHRYSYRDYGRYGHGG